MKEISSLWNDLVRCERPIVIYGTGNGADKIFSALERYGIRPDAVFASDGFVRERTFRGYPVRSYSDIIAEYGDDITVLLAFGTTLPDVTEFIRELDRRHELIIPDAPLFDGDLFDGEYFTAHEKVLENAASVLSDERSKKLFSDVIVFRLTGKLGCLADTEDARVTLAELFGGKEFDTVVDGGAFKGDSTAMFADALHPKKIYAVEADPKTYIKLCDYAARETRCEVVPVNAALSNVCGTKEYISSSSRGSGSLGQNKRAKVTEIEAKTITSIVGGDKVDFIKLDVEGDERAALDGAKEIIVRDEPNLAVSLYHRTDDLYSLILYVRSLLPKHRLYLRRVPCIPMWDLMLYAVK